MRSNIYIRQENEEAWAAIQDKSDWVNSHLADQSTEPVFNPKTMGRAPADTICKAGHFARGGKCLQKGCKYGL